MRSRGQVPRRFTRSMRNLIFGTAASTVLALVLIVPSLWGISTWKIVLAALGLGLIVLSGRARSA